jgi:hypothetical protein
MQTSKQKLSIIKSRMEPQEKLLAVSENVSQWSSIDKESRTPSLESERENATQRPSIFRRQGDFEDQEDMFVLKRANPVYDSDDEDYLSSPAKRQRTTGPTVLSWGEVLQEDDTDGFTLSIPSL